MHVFVHFIDKIHHSEIEWKKTVAEIGKPIEEVAIVPTEVDGNDVTMILNALGDKSLFPGQVTNDARLTARSQSGREHQHVVVALKAGFHHSGEVT